MSSRTVLEVLIRYASDKRSVAQTHLDEATYRKLYLREIWSDITDRAQVEKALEPADALIKQCAEECAFWEKSGVELERELSIHPGSVDPQVAQLETSLADLNLKVSEIDLGLAQTIDQMTDEGVVFRGRLAERVKIEATAALWGSDSEQGLRQALGSILTLVGGGKDLTDSSGRSIEDLIAASSLGTPDVVALRRSVDPKLVERVLRRAQELEHMTTPPNKTEPSPVVRAFGGATVAYECPNCGALHRVHAYDTPGAAKALASQCCGPWFCEKHQAVIPARWGCDACSSERRAESERKSFDSAKKVPLAEYTGEYLYRDGFGSEGYFTDGDVDNEPEKYPDWAFGCDLQTVSEDSCNLTDHVAEGILSDHHEEAIENADPAKIEEASKLIYEALKDIKSYLPDESVVVLLRTPATTTP